MTPSGTACCDHLLTRRNVMSFLFAGGQAPAHFGVGCYLKNYGRQNNLGLLVTSHTDERHADSGREGQNTTVSVDGFIQPTQPLTIN